MSFRKLPSSLLSMAQAAARMYEAHEEQEQYRKRQLENIKSMLSCTDEELDSILEILAGYHAAGISVDVNALLRILSLPKSATGRRTMLATDKLDGRNFNDID